MSQFTFEVVSDAIDAVRGQCSLVIDKNDNPHVAYTTTVGKIVIASKNTGAWVRERLDTGPLAQSAQEQRVWLQIDSAGQQPHIACIEEGTVHLKYGVRGPDFRWSFRSVPSSLRVHQPDVVAHMSFALHPGRLSPELRDMPHFFFEDQTTDSLGYARLVDGEFKLSTAAAALDLGDAGSSEIGQFTSMAFDESSQTIRFSCVETILRASKVHVGRVLNVTEGQFATLRSFEEGESFLAPTSIFTQDANTWVAYSNVSEQVLKALTLGGGGEPSIETVAPIVARTAPSLTKSPVIAEVSEGLRIAFSDDGKVKFARRRRFEGWTVEVVDEADGVLPSMAYDRRGNGHIAYAAGRTLKYARVTE